MYDDSSTIRLNFRKPVNLIFCSLFLLSILGGAVAGIIQWRAQLSVYDRLSIVTVNDTSYDLEFTLNYVSSELNALSRIIEKKLDPEHIYNKPSEIASALMDLLRVMPTTRSVFIANTKDDFFSIPFASSTTYDNDDIHLFKPSNRPWFIGPNDNPEVNKYTGVYDDWFTKAPQFNISTKIFYQHENDYSVIGLDVDVKRLNDALEIMKKTLSGAVFIIDEEGHKVLGPSERWRPISASILESFNEVEGVVDDPQNQRRLFYSKISHPSWTVLMAVDYDILHRTVLYESIMPVIAFLTLLMFLAFAWFRSLEALNLFYLRLANSINNSGDHSSMVDKLLEQEINKSRADLQKIEASTRTDALTQIFNRRAFDDDLSALIQDGNSSLILTLIDIDNFKTVNDKWGHQAGDDVLRVFAAIARDTRSDDHQRLYRYGGEEFAILFTNITYELALERVELIRSSFSTRKWRDGLPKQTFSAGMASWEGEAVSMLITRADALLYQAKRNGKNRVIGKNSGGLS